MVMVRCTYWGSISFHGTHVGTMGIEDQAFSATYWLDFTLFELEPFVVSCVVTCTRRASSSFIRTQSLLWPDVFIANDDESGISPPAHGYYTSSEPPETSLLSAPCPAVPMHASRASLLISVTNCHWRQKHRERECPILHFLSYSFFN